MVDLQAAFLAKDKVSFDAMLLRLSPKDRAGVLTVFRHRNKPDELRRRLVAMGYKAERIGPLPYLDDDVKNGEAGRRVLYHKPSGASCGGAGSCGCQACGEKAAERVEYGADAPGDPKNCGDGSGGFKLGNRCSGKGKPASGQGKLGFGDDKPKSTLVPTAPKEESKSSVAEKPPAKKPEDYAVGEIIPAEEAGRLIGAVRGGDTRSKNKGDNRAAENVGDLTRVDLPISMFPKDYLEFLKETTAQERVDRYVAEKVKTPIYATNTKKRGEFHPGGWRLSDGGHRLMAAIARGDKTIPAFVPVKDKAAIAKSPITRIPKTADAAARLNVLINLLGGQIRKRGGDLDIKGRDLAAHRRQQVRDALDKMTADKSANPAPAFSLGPPKPRGGFKDVGKGTTPNWFAAEPRREDLPGQTSFLSRVGYERGEDGRLRRIIYAGANCGDGSGGFKAGNTCAGKSLRGQGTFSFGGEHHAPEPEIKQETKGEATAAKEEKSEVKPEPKPEKITSSLLHQRASDEVRKEHEERKASGKEWPNVTHDDLEIRRQKRRAKLAAEHVEHLGEEEFVGLMRGEGRKDMARGNAVRLIQDIAKKKKADAEKAIEGIESTRTGAIHFARTTGNWYDKPTSGITRAIAFLPAEDVYRAAYHAVHGKPTAKRTNYDRAINSLRRILYKRTGDQSGPGVRHAPVGGSSARGADYLGGQFLPGDADDSDAGSGGTGGKAKKNDNTALAPPKDVGEPGEDFAAKARAFLGQKEGELRKRDQVNRGEADPVAVTPEPESASTPESTPEPAPSSKDFAGHVHEVGQAIGPEGRVGGKLLASHVLKKYAEWHGTVSPEEFRTRLQEAHNGGHLQFEAMDAPHPHAPGYIAAKGGTGRARGQGSGPDGSQRVDTASQAGGEEVATTPTWMPPRVAPAVEAKPEAEPMVKTEPAKGTAARNKLAGRLKAAREKLKAAESKAAESEAKDPASHTDHPPGTFSPLKPDLIHFDPDRFQYKLNTSGKAGTTDKFKGVRSWNPEFGGILAVWKDPKDKKTYVINGHHRLELAKKLGAPEVQAQFLDAPNAEAAKAKGAMINIAEGHGTAIDAANFFRNSNIGKEDLERHGISMKEDVANRGVALSRLSDPVFKRVISGDLAPDKGAMIGAADLTPAQQDAMVKLMDRMPKGKQMSLGRLRERLDNIKAARSKTVKTFDLFGENEDEVSMGGHRADVQDAVRDRLGKEKRLFGTVAKTKSAAELSRAGNVIDTEESGRVSEEAAAALSVFDLLKNSSGTDIPKALDEAAERIHNGESKKKVHDETYRRILAEIPKVLGQRQGASPKHVREGVQGSGSGSGVEAGEGLPALSDVRRTDYQRTGRRVAYDRATLGRWLRSHLVVAPAMPSRVSAVLAPVPTRPSISFVAVDPADFARIRV